MDLKRKYDIKKDKNFKKKDNLNNFILLLNLKFLEL